jgi:hypothetical protein
MRRVAEGIAAIARNPDLPRTKRAIEVASGLSHDAVARAFRQDRDEGSEFSLNSLFEQLVAEQGSRRSPSRQREHDADKRLLEAKLRMQHLEAALHAHAQVIMTQQLELEAMRESRPRVVPLPRRGHSGQ